ncbi:MAG: hypothetical protein IJ266_00415 [Elusimicrobiaceae bacterium]|nr:hypothetical protein [Elusimicrobiaceae bacterium]
MNTSELLEQISSQCDQLRLLIQQQTGPLTDFSRRILQISQQLRKNIEVRDTSFAEEFNTYTTHLRQTLDALEPAWAQLRAQVRQTPDKNWTGELALAAKGLNSRAKALSGACDEFVSEYDVFCKRYKNFTAAKLNVWLLTSCQNDISSLTGKILFLARELARKTEQNREPTYER